MKFKTIVKCVGNFLEEFPMFRKSLVANEHGDLVETVEEMTLEEKIEASKISTSPDAFAAAIDKVPDTMYIDKFDAIAQLNAAIAGINYKKPEENGDENR